MHPLVTLLSCLNAQAITNSFWNDVDRVSELADPPPAHLLEKIQEHPWRGGLEPVSPEGIPLHEAKVVEGKIPPDLEGTLCRNGPGRIRVGDIQYGHWFDGDGIVTRLSIDGKSQKATYDAKYVETKRFEAQQKSSDDSVAKAGAWTKRGQGKWWQNLFAIPTNPSNTNVIFFTDGKTSPSMYALAEGGNPVKINPSTLATIGEAAFQSSTGEKTASFFSAHYASDPKTGHIYNHGVVLAPKTAVNIMELDQHGELIQQSATELPLLTFIHDNALSENYFVLLLPPFTTPPNAMLDSLLGGEPLGKQFAWNPDGNEMTTAMIFSKKTLDCIARVSLPLLSTYHLLDAFDDGNVVTLRVLVHEPPNSRNRVEECFSDMYSAEDLPLCRMMEYCMDVESGKMISSRRIAPDAAPCELPDMNMAWGYRKRYIYTNTREEGVDFTNSLQKVDLDTGKCSNLISFGDDVYAGSPIFVPKEDAKKEDDGYVLAQLYRAKEHGSDICILDARSMKKVTQLRLARPVPYQFHGAWFPGLF